MNFLASLKAKRETRSAAMNDYRRLLSILADGSELAAGDAKRMEQVVTELALTVLDVEGDLAALQSERKLRPTAADVEQARHQHRCITVMRHEIEQARTLATAAVWEKFSPMARDRELGDVCNKFNAEDARLSQALSAAQRRLDAASRAGQDLADLHRGHPRLFDPTPDPTPEAVHDHGELVG